MVSIKTQPQHALPSPQLSPLKNVMMEIWMKKTVARAIVQSLMIGPVPILFLIEGQAVDATRRTDGLTTAMNAKRCVQ